MPVSSSTSLTAANRMCSPLLGLPLGKDQSSYLGRWITAISIPTPSWRQSTAPAARVMSSGSSIHGPPSSGPHQEALDVKGRRVGPVGPVGRDGRVPRPYAVRVQPPRHGVVVHPPVEQLNEVGPVAAVPDPYQRLDPPVEVAVHEVGAADPDLWVAAALERVHARVLEEPAEDAADLDRLRKTGDPGAQRADAAYPDVDRDAGHRGPVQRVDDDLVDDRVALEPDMGRPAGPVVFHLALDAQHETRAQGVRGHQELPVGDLTRVAGQVVEQVGDVLDDLRV